MATLEELLALLPDNTTGAIDAADLRTIVTELYHRDDELEARVGALEATDSSGGDVFSVTGVWQVVPGANATPGGGQVATDTGSFGTATILRFARIDKLNQDAIAALLNTTNIFAQMKMNAANWVTFDVTGTPTLNGSVISVPVVVLKSSGTTGAAAWQDAAIVLNVQTSAYEEVIGG